MRVSFHRRHYFSTAFSTERVEHLSFVAAFTGPVNQDTGMIVDLVAIDQTMEKICLSQEKTKATEERTLETVTKSCYEDIASQFKDCFSGLTLTGNECGVELCKKPSKLQLFFIALFSETLFFYEGEERKGIPITLEIKYPGESTPLTRALLQTQIKKALGEELSPPLFLKQLHSEIIQEGGGTVQIKCTLKGHKSQLLEQS